MRLKTKEYWHKRFLKKEKLYNKKSKKYYISIYKKHRSTIDFINSCISINLIKIFHRGSVVIGATELKGDFYDLSYLINGVEFKDDELDELDSYFKFFGFQLHHKPISIGEGWDALFIKAMEEINYRR